MQKRSRLSRTEGWLLFLFCIRAANLTAMTHTVHPAEYHVGIMERGTIVMEARYQRADAGVYLPMLFGLAKYGVKIDHTSNDGRWLYLSVPESSTVFNEKGTPMCGLDLERWTCEALAAAGLDVACVRYIVREGEEYNKEMATKRYRTLALAMQGQEG